MSTVTHSPATAFSVWFTIHSSSPPLLHVRHNTEPLQVTWGGKWWHFNDLSSIILLTGWTLLLCMIRVPSHLQEAPDSRLSLVVGQRDLLVTELGVASTGKCRFQQRRPSNEVHIGHYLTDGHCRQLTTQWLTSGHLHRLKTHQLTTELAPTHTTPATQSNLHSYSTPP